MKRHADRQAFAFRISDTGLTKRGRLPALRQPVSKAIAFITVQHNPGQKPGWREFGLKQLTTAQAGHALTVTDNPFADG